MCQGNRVEWWSNGMIYLKDTTPNNSGSVHLPSNDKMLTEAWAWGVIPRGFKKITDESGGRLVVRLDQESRINFALCREQDESGISSRFEGRAKLRAVRLENGQVALIREYRHGGVLRGLTGNLFFSWPPRPFRELAITEELRRRGVPTVEVYAACITQVVGPVYRGWLVSRELSGAQDLWMAVRSGFMGEVGSDAVWHAVARSVRMLHRHGVYHRDLNLKNILVRREGSELRGYVIDFDKAMLMLGELSPELARRNLARVLRSMRKLDPDCKYFSNGSWNKFVRYYDLSRREL